MLANDDKIQNKEFRKQQRKGLRRRRVYMETVFLPILEIPFGSILYFTPEFRTNCHCGKYQCLTFQIHIKVFQE